MIKYIVPSVNSELKLERRCPHCGRLNGNINTRIHQRHKATLRSSASVKRPWCGTSWTVRANGAAAGRQRSDQLTRMQIRVLGVDGTSAKMAGKKTGLLFFVDIKQQKLVCAEAVDEKNSRVVRQHVCRVMREVGAEQLRTEPRPPTLPDRLERRALLLIRVYARSRWIM